MLADKTKIQKVTEVAVMAIEWTGTLCIWIVVLVLLVMGIFGGGASLEVTGLVNILK